MAKTAGIAWTTLSVDDTSGSVEAIKNDVTDFEYEVSQGIQESTGVDKSAMERIGLLADFSVTLNGVANFATSPSEFDVFKVLANARTVTLAFASKSLSCETLFSKHGYKRDNDGKLTWTAEGDLADGTVPTFV